MLGSPTKKFVQPRQSGLKAGIVVGGDLVGDEIAAVVVVVVVVVGTSHQGSVQHLDKDIRAIFLKHQL